MVASGLSPATVRKAVFALRQCLAAAIADRRLALNPADDVPLPAERCKPPRYLSQAEVERLVDEMPERYGLWSWSARTAGCAGVRPSV